MSYVAEVWLEWPICTGSTMYRTAAKTRWGAWLKAKFAAMVLNLRLPRFYWDTDWSGRPYRYAHDFGIKFGVRQPTEREQQDGVTAIWSTRMPGHHNFSGEHPDAHPWNEARLGKLQGTGLEDVKL